MDSGVWAGGVASTLKSYLHFIFDWVLGPCAGLLGRWAGGRWGWGLGYAHMRWAAAAVSAMGGAFQMRHTLMSLVVVLEADIQ